MTWPTIAVLQQGKMTAAACCQAGMI